MDLSGDDVVLKMCKAREMQVSDHIQASASLGHSVS